MISLRRSMVGFLHLSALTVRHPQPTHRSRRRQQREHLYRAPQVQRPSVSELAVPRDWQRQGPRRNAPLRCLEAPCPNQFKKLRFAMPEAEDLIYHCVGLRFLGKALVDNEHLSCAINLNGPKPTQGRPCGPSLAGTSQSSRVMCALYEWPLDDGSLEEFPERALKTD